MKIEQVAEMTKETRAIEVVAYRDKDGNPCCAGDFEKGEVCVFYRAYRLGCGETCVFAETGAYKRQQEMQRRGEDGLGTLIPLPQCPVWAGKLEEQTTKK